MLPAKCEKIDYLRDAHCELILDKVQVSSQLPVPAHVNLSDPPAFPESLLMSRAGECLD